MLTVDPKKRISAEDAIKHEFFQDAKEHEFIQNIINNEIEEN